jgi:hypothetical protein
MATQEDMSSQNMGQVLQIKFDQLKQNINIIKTALSEIDNVSGYAFFNQETRVMIEAYKQKEKVNLFRDSYFTLEYQNQ